MPRLRMKPSSSTTNTDEAVLRASRRAHKKSKRHRHAQEEESISPPRHRPTPRIDSDDFDESSLPPSQAYKKTREEEEFKFEEKLREASTLDQGIGYQEQTLYQHELAYSTSYGSAAGNAAGLSRRGQVAMEEEEYAEYIRAGMWRLQNKERLEFIEKQEKLKKEREAKERIEREEREKKELAKRRKLQEKKREESRLERDRARERYDLGWKKLQTLSSSTTEQGLRFTDFVWPLFPPFALPPISWPTPNELTTTSIEEFLLPDSLGEEERKARIRGAVLSYHPDRFARLLDKIKEEESEDGESGGVRERVRELGLRVSQVLNDLLKDEKNKGKK
ncbi:uncharacterized protein JCM6883_006715 [Sporobolomyces salmoneus]|uniref:uncharacterized protein n=1 Tax=Sporobolomyces salmoneus TaxID=183962 RepID=UPI00317AE76F